jgi:hypothetical protein
VLVFCEAAMTISQLPEIASLRGRRSLTRQDAKTM